MGRPRDETSSFAPDSRLAARDYGGEAEYSQDEENEYAGLTEEELAMLGPPEDAGTMPKAEFRYKIHVWVKDNVYKLLL